MGNDHTEEVEEKIKAIRIDGEDKCAFYIPKEGFVFRVKRCTFCRYASFEDKKSQGLCKWRPEEEKDDESEENDKSIAKPTSFI